MPSHSRVGDVVRELARRQRAERDERRLGVQLLPRRRAQTETGDDLVRPAGERLEHRLRLGRVRGLAEQLAVEQHLGVDAEHGAFAGRRPSGPCPPRARAGRCRAPRRSRGRRPRTGSPSCVRIARRCGEVDARTSGGAGGALTRSAPSSLRRWSLSRDPDLLARPLARPVRRHVRVVLVRLRRPPAPGARSAARSRSRSRAAGRSIRRAARWNSTPPSGHSKRFMPNCGARGLLRRHLVGRSRG